MGLSTGFHLQPGSKLRESDHGCGIRQEGPNFLLSPRRETRRIPEGTVFAEIPLEACKSYPIRIWEGLELTPRIAYADRNTHQENNILTVKLEPNGGKTAPHPQVVLYVKGPYHVETLGYLRSDPKTWTTWMELYLDGPALDSLILGLMKAKLKMREIKT